MTLELATQPRAAGTKPETVREQGAIPAVVYGKKQDALSIIVDYKVFDHLYKEAGESTMISLTTEKGAPMDVLIQEVQRHPVTGKIIHIDFKAIEAGKPVEVMVQLEFVGEAPIENQNQGTVTKVMHELEIEALPKNLPHGIKVDISGMTEMDSQILVQDIKLPTGVTTNVDPEEVVAVIAALQEEVEEEAPAEIDFSAIAVEQKGKEASDEDGEGASE